METVTLRADEAAKLTGKSPEELKALLEGKEQNEASTLFADTVAQNFSALRKRIAEDKYNQGIKEKGQAIERELGEIFQKYGIADFKTAEEGIKLLSTTLEQQGKTGTPDLSKLTPEQLADLPQVKSQMDRLSKLSQALEAKEKEFSDYKQAQQRQAIDHKALNSTISIFTKDKANIGQASVEDAARMFLFSIPANRRGLDKEGNIIPLDENGQPATDNYGHQLTWDQYVKKQYAFGFHVADPNKGGAGGNGGSSDGGGSSAKLKIRSQEEGQQLLSAAVKSNDKARAAEVRRAMADYIREAS